MPADRTELLGNYVSSAAEGGCHVLLAHLQYDSLQVTAGGGGQGGQISGQGGHSRKTNGPQLHPGGPDGVADGARILINRRRPIGVPLGFPAVLPGNTGALPSDGRENRQ